MQGVLSITLVLLVALTVTTEAMKSNKDHPRKARHGKGKEGKPSSDCTEWTYGKCVPEAGDCGPGVREATCKDTTKKIHCKIPCNWKKDLNDCKYKFTNWGDCDAVTATKSRTGSLKKAMYNAECQTTVKVSKPCTPKLKSIGIEKRKNGN